MSTATHQLVAELASRVARHCADHGIPLPKPSHPIKFRPHLRLRPDVHDLVLAEFRANYLDAAVQGETVVAVLGFPVTRGLKDGPEFEIRRPV